MAGGTGAAGGAGTTGGATGVSGTTGGVTGAVGRSATATLATRGNSQVSDGIVKPSTNVFEEADQRGADVIPDNINNGNTPADAEAQVVSQEGEGQQQHQPIESGVGKKKEKNMTPEEKQKAMENGGVSTEDSSTKKAVRTVGRGVAAYYTGGKSLGYDQQITSSNAGNKLLGVVSDGLDKVPGVEEATKELDDSGTLDAAEGALDAAAAIKNKNPEGIKEAGEKVKSGLEKGKKARKERLKKHAIIFLISCAPLLLILLIVIITGQETGAKNTVINDDNEHTISMTVTVAPDEDYSGGNTQYEGGNSGNPESGGPGCYGAVASATSDANNTSTMAGRLFQYLKNSGYNDTAAAAVLGNVKAESNFSLTSTNSIGAYGLAQWLGSRKTALQKYANSIGKSMASEDAQFGFIVYEMTTGYNMPPDVMNAKSLEDATWVFHRSYEGPESVTCTKSNPCYTNRFTCPEGGEYNCVNVSGNSKGKMKYWNDRNCRTPVSSKVSWAELSASPGKFYAAWLSVENRIKNAYNLIGVTAEECTGTGPEAEDESGAGSSGAAAVGLDGYNYSSSGSMLINGPLSQVLASKGSSVDALNNKIKENINKNGCGTRNAVVAAASTLLGELNNYKIKLQYEWGGNGNIVGANGKWGTYNPSAKPNKYGNTYPYTGMDCSSFVRWAIYNGGFKYPSVVASQYYEKVGGGKKVTLDANRAVLQPGDLLENSQHIVLIVGIDESSKEYICAEAQGLNAGIVFSRKKFGDTSKWGVDMTNYYNTKSRGSCIS